MISADEKAMGAFVRRHPVDNTRRGWTAVIAVILGLTAGGLAVPMLVAAFDLTYPAQGVRLPGLLLGFALVFLWAGIVNSVRYFTRYDELYRLREGGLAYELLGETLLIPWQDIARVSDIGWNNMLNRPLGMGVHCRIRLRSGRRLLVSGFVEDAAQLSAAIRLAVHQGVTPRA